MLRQQGKFKGEPWLRCTPLHDSVWHGLHLTFNCQNHRSDRFSKNRAVQYEARKGMVLVGNATHVFRPIPQRNPRSPGAKMLPNWLLPELGAPFAVCPYTKSPRILCRVYMRPLT